MGKNYQVYWRWENRSDSKVTTYNIPGNGSREIRAADARVLKRDGWGGKKLPGL